MTLGERLKQLREEKQLSQEELGNLLLADEQTVSMWENNEMVPTVDNLIKLKEVFGVSIDSILEDEDTKKSEPEISASDYCETTEKICFSLNKDELKYMHKMFTTIPLRNLVLWMFCIIFLMITTFSESPEEQNSYVLIILSSIFLFFSLGRYIYSWFANKKSAELICSRKYTCEVFSDYILMNISEADNEIKTHRVNFNEFVKCWEMPFCYFLEVKKRRYYVIKKSSINETSRLNYFCQKLKTPKTDFSSTKVTILKTIGYALFVGCFISFFASIAISLGFVSQNVDTLSVESLEALKIFHCFLPIPLFSIIVGILLNKNKIRNKKNIICGIIIGLLMIVYGLFPTIFSNVTDNLNLLETQLGFEFPQTVGMKYNTTNDLTGNKQIRTTLNFAESATDDFEEFMQEDERWIKGSNKAFAEIIPETIVNFPSDYFLIYNINTSEFVKIPKSDGQYQLIYIAYSSELNVAYIYEYQYTVK